MDRRIWVVLFLIGVFFIGGCVECPYKISNPAQGLINKDCECHGLRIIRFCIGTCGENCSCSSFLVLENDIGCISSGPCDSIKFKTEYELCSIKDECEWQRGGESCSIYCNDTFEIDINYNGIIEDDEKDLHCWDEPINIEPNLLCYCEPEQREILLEDKKFDDLEYCKDTDGGRFRFVKGIIMNSIEDINSDVEDYCWIKLSQNKGQIVNECLGENCFLNEHWCETSGSYNEYENLNNDVHRYMSADIQCSQGCKNGACIKE